MASRKTQPVQEPGSWTFLTNHAHVLLCLSADPQMRLREVATQVGITERAVQRIVADLEAAGYVKKRRVGRCNQYRVKRTVALRHPLEAHRTVSAILALIEPGGAGERLPGPARAVGVPVAEAQPQLRQVGAQRPNRATKAR